MRNLYFNKDRTELWEAGGSQINLRRRVVASSTSFAYNRFCTECVALVGEYRVLKALLGSDCGFTNPFYHNLNIIEELWELITPTLPFNLIVIRKYVDDIIMALLRDGIDVILITSMIAIRTISLLLRTTWKHRMVGCFFGQFIWTPTSVILID